MRKFTMLIAMCVAIVATAQELSVGEPVMLQGTEQGGFYHPMFAPNGSFVLTTSENYAGLRKHDLSRGTVKQLSKADGAGYGVRISKDSKKIFARHYSYVDNMRYTSIERIKASTGSSKTMRKAIHGQQAPEAEVEQVYVTVRNKLMVLHRGNAEQVVAPNGEKESYFWCSVSPDAQHIVYSTARLGTWVCDINGGNPVSLGWMNAPVWYGNDRIVAMQDSDDGEQVTASTIVTRKIDGSGFQVLPTGQKIAMYPAASADGKRIAFNNNEGQIFIMEVK